MEIYPVDDKSFQKAFERIYSNVTANYDANLEYNCAIFVGGQPGVGKSTFYRNNPEFENYIAINGDSYRKYHPHYDEIVSHDIENLAQRTQDFVNKCVETMIEKLSDMGYNMIIEGTLRNPDVPINTCKHLKEKGYASRLYVVCCDAINSWKSTINRAKVQQSEGENVRFVPIDKYNRIVNNLPKSMERIEKANCFDELTLYDRQNNVLYHSSTPYKNEIKSATETFSHVLNVERWNSKYQELSDAFVDMKIVEMMQHKTSLSI